MKKVLIVDDMQSWREFNTHAVQEILGDDVEIVQTSSAREGYDALLDNYKEPFDIIITDLQMESDFEPKLAGEWLVEEIKEMKKYLNTKVIIVSSSYKIKYIAERCGVYAIPKATAVNDLTLYKELLI